jgi:hypothetical protein
MRQPSKSALFEAAKAWDAARVKALIETSPDLICAVDPKGRTAIHFACSMKPGTRALGEANGVKTVTALLNGGADLELAAPGEEDEEDFRATPSGSPSRAARTQLSCDSCWSAEPMQASRSGPSSGGMTTQCVGNSSKAGPDSIFWRMARRQSFMPRGSSV